MLRLEKAALGKFGAQEMMSLINSSGWRAVLPDALNDSQLLLVSHQLRDLMAGVTSNDDDGPSGAALPLTLLLLTRAGARQEGDNFEIKLETLQEAVSLLNVTVDREIVNRILQRKDETSVESALMQGLETLVRHAANHTTVG